MPKTLLIDPADSVMVALTPVGKGETVEGIEVIEDIPMGHKIARFDLAAGSPIVKYGQPIGFATRDIQAGSHVHSHNLKTGLGTRQSYAYRPQLSAVSGIDRAFSGYVRSDGLVGIRNDLYIIPLVGCVVGLCRRLGERLGQLYPDQADAIKVLAHPYGCSQVDEDLEVTRKVLQGLARNPNAGAVMLIGLGCENNRLSDFMRDFKPRDKKRFFACNLQEFSNDEYVLLQAGSGLLLDLQTDERTFCPLSSLRLGLKCGGSDGLSGLTANPLVGRISDLVGGSGGRVLLTEVPEMFGAEQLLMNRAADGQIFDRVVSLIENFKDYYARYGKPCYENPSPGNRDGGITTLEEKSLGCIRKGGTLTVTDVLDYGDEVTKAGLTLVNGPGNDLVASTNLAAAGATLLLFTTGRGTPFGSVIPTIKVSSNSALAVRKHDWIDFDGGTVLADGFDKTAEELLSFALDVCSGWKTKSEKQGAAEIAIFKEGVTL